MKTYNLKIKGWLGFLLFAIIQYNFVYFAAYLSIGVTLVLLAITPFTRRKVEVDKNVPISTEYYKNVNTSILYCISVCFVILHWQFHYSIVHMLLATTIITAIISSICVMFAQSLVNGTPFMMIREKEAYGIKNQQEEVVEPVK